MMTVAVETEHNLTADDSLDLQDFNFKLAFSAHNYLDPRIKYDDRSKVEWVVESVTYDGLEIVSK
jgi:hypothetical protein